MILAYIYTYEMITINGKPFPVSIVVSGVKG